MEPRQIPNFDEKINRLIYNRNLKEHSCFIGLKTQQEFTHVATPEENAHI